MRRRHRWSYVAFLAPHPFLVAVFLNGVPVMSNIRTLVEGGAEALVNGVFSYGIKVLAAYERLLDWTQSPSVLVDGRITYGYPYPPVPLLGEIRLAHVLAMVHNPPPR